MKDNYDCVVVGGGPAGSTTATLVAAGGHSTLLLERERIPRCRVGESLAPETYNTLARLGVLEAMKASRFLRKTGVQFVSSDGADSQSFYFQERDPGESSLTWHVERAAFDRLLCENAVARGVEFFDRTRVSDILTDGERVCGVEVLTPSGQMQRIHCRVLVDATGQQALLANRLDLFVPDEAPPAAAIWGYYRNARREPGDPGGAALLLHTRSKGAWFWNIPLADEVSSIGVLGSAGKLLTGRAGLAEAFEDALVECPALIDRLYGAELVSTFHSAEGFSFAVRRRAGDGWVLVGDASGSVYPLFGAGVHLAMTSGEWAADAIVAGLRRNDLSARQLGCWTERFERGVHRLARYARTFTSPDFSFGRLVTLSPHRKAQVADLLMGRVFDRPDDPAPEVESWFCLPQGDKVTR